MTDETKGIRPGDRLPAHAFTALGDPTRVNLRDGRYATILVAVEADTLHGFATWLHRLANALPRFRVWDGRAFIIVHDADALPQPGASFADIPFLRGDGAPTALRASRGHALVIVADRFGDVYHVAAGRDAAELTDPIELEEWLRYMATQCPECGVPDEPGLGEWTP